MIIYTITAKYEVSIATYIHMSTFFWFFFGGEVLEYQLECFFSPNRPTGPLGRLGLIVAMSVHMLYVCMHLVPFPCNFFQVVSLALRSHDHFKASDWSTPLHYQTQPPPPNAATAAGRDKKELKRFFFKFVSVLQYYPHRSRELVSPLCGVFMS